MNAPAGCAPSDLYGGDVVTCSTPTAVRVELGAGDDDGDMSDGLPIPVTLSGGAGDDWLNADTQPDDARRRPRRRQARRRHGRRRRCSAATATTSSTARTARDRIDGGAGDDLLRPRRLRARERRRRRRRPGLRHDRGRLRQALHDGDPPVAITLGGGADDGRAGEGDDVRNVEKV